MKLFTKFIAVIFLIFVLQGCRKNVFEPLAVQSNPNYLSKEKAINYLKTFLANNQTNLFNTNARGVIDTSHKYNYSSRDIDYDLMRDVQLTNGQNMQVVGLRRMEEDCNNYSRLLMAQNHDSIFAYIFEVVVDDSIINSYHGNTDSIKAVYNFINFSGIINVYDLRGNLLRSYECLKGKIIHNVVTSYCANCRAMVMNDPHELPNVVVTPHSNTPTPVFTQFPWIFGGGGDFPSYPGPTTGGGGGGSGGPSTGGGGPLEGPCGDGGGAALTDENGYYYSRKNQLVQLLQDDDFGLIPCGQLLAAYGQYGDMFRQIAGYQIPQSVYQRIESVRNASVANGGPILDNFNIENINDAFGGVVNCDFFPVKIDNLPEKSPGVRMTSDEFLEYFRLHINDFVDPSLGYSFSPYVDPQTNDTQKFNSPFESSLGSLIHIAIPTPNYPNNLLLSALNGSVVITDYTRSHNISTNYDFHKFKFSTIETPLDNEHPVAGNREFGIYTDPSQSGKFVFYTMGVDRTWDVAFTAGNGLFDGFQNADVLWRNIQSKMIAYIGSHGGSAGYYSGTPSVTFRPPWNDVEQFLRSEITLQELKNRLGC